MPRPRLLLLAAVLLCGASLARADLTLMPLGDSITFGAKDGNVGGYRYPLYLDLTKAGIGFHFLGQSAENCLPLPLDQQHHNGYPGATIEDIQNNLTADAKSPDMVVSNYGGHWMTGGAGSGGSVNPSAVLLLIGTNNIYHHPKDCDAAKMEPPYQKLVAWFLTNRPNTQLLLGTLPPTIKEPRQNETAVEFNKWLRAQAPAWGPKCHLVDLDALFLNADGSTNAKLLPDGIHPSREGYEAMGAAWGKAVQDLVAKGTLPKEPPSAPSGSFEPPTGNQSPIPGISVAVAPLNAAAGATIVVSGSVAAGNNLLTAPVVSFSLGDGKHQAATLAESVTLANIAPHKSVPFKMEFKLPQNLEPGTYFLGATAKAPEGGALIRFGPKITVAK
jgi:lysophospholipase L1-like esterase